MTTTTDTPCLVSSEGGAAVAGTKKPFIISLKLGQDLFPSILKCLKDAQLESAILTGLGAVDDVEVAYYNLDTKSYQTKMFEGTFELVSLNGNMAYLDGEPFLHIHAAIGTDEYQVYGGHIMQAKVGPSVEIAVTPLEGRMERSLDERCGLKTLTPER